MGSVVRNLYFEVIFKNIGSFITNDNRVSLSWSLRLLGSVFRRLHSSTACRKRLILCYIFQDHPWLH